MNSTLEGVIAPFFSSLISINQSGKRVMFCFGWLCFCFVILFFWFFFWFWFLVVPFLVLVLVESVVPFGPAGKGFVLYSFRWSLTFNY